MTSAYEEGEATVYCFDLSIGLQPFMPAVSIVRPGGAHTVTEQMMHRTWPAQWHHIIWCGGGPFPRMHSEVGHNSLEG